MGNNGCPRVCIVVNSLFDKKIDIYVVLTFV